MKLKPTKIQKKAAILDDEHCVNAKKQIQFSKKYKKLKVEQNDSTRM